MQLLDDGTLCFSASDLRLASQCEFALARSLDVTLGRVDRAAASEDPFLARVAELGTAHEQQVLLSLVKAHRERVVQIPAPSPRTVVGFAQAHERTFEALHSSAEVVYQGVFFDRRFLGYADFLVREGGLWTICDTKLALHSSVPALLQIASYADQLRSAGIPTSGVARLILGDGAEQDFPLDDILPVFRERRARLVRLLEEHHSSDAAARWGDPRWLACGRCDICVAELESSRDVLLVAGCRVSQRKVLQAAGVDTVETLATRDEPVRGLAASTLERLRAQARLQVTQDSHPDRESDPRSAVSFEVHTPEALAVLPRPSAGDLFFDFEGDPMYTENGCPDWGLEYLFGVTALGTDSPEFTPFWAHDRAGEKQALLDFLTFVQERRSRFPDLHIYHYAPYERSALLRLAARHGVGEEQVDDILRGGVLVDLYAVVRSAIRVSQRSYSIKKLEPLYMGGELRESDVTTGGDSIVAYHQFCRARDAGAMDKAQALLDGISDYNEYDCLSTLRLRDWLLAQAAASQVQPVPGARAVGEAGDLAVPEADPLQGRLRAHIEHSPPGLRSADEQAVAMVAATIHYNKREQKPYWWSHFDRLRNPVDEWVGTTDVFQVESATVDRRGWFKEGRQRSLRRVVRLVGSFASGSKTAVGSSVKVVYDQPVPDGLEVMPGHVRACGGSATVLSRDAVGQDREVVVVEETLPKGCPPFDALPLALSPAASPRTDSIDAALHELGESVLARVEGALPLPAQPGIDVLRRLPPRLRSGGQLPAAGSGDDRFTEAIAAAVLGLDRSYLAVQGPPGTGKTHVGSEVIGRLITRHGWRVGVVAQSHAAVENVLDAVVRGGVDPKLVGKAPQHGDVDRPWTVLGRDDLASFLTSRSETGCVVGGTAWDMTNLRRVARGQLDLLVVDEAGQYSLATTIACSVAAQRLLLLGDPQQLGQVSQGTHPEPVDGSALAWVLDGAPIIPSDRGYFLALTWRMHPLLTERISRLSYAGQLLSHEPVTSTRRLEGLEPGLHVIDVSHRDNSTESVEEAEEVVRQAQSVIGSPWEDPDEGGPVRPLAQSDIRVVAPYNRQVTRIRRAMAAAGLDDVPVGTVDTFQGQQAVVAIISMTASARSEISRGMAFLLDRNRLNVAVSRGKWASILIRSDVLTDFSPSTPDELLALGAFIGLCEPTV